MTDGENGLLIPVGGERALGYAMTSLAEDAALAERLGRNAAQIRQRLDETQVAAKWRQYLETIYQTG
jgi:glycosyltransferase involved in cell wall biosynthesis